MSSNISRRDFLKATAAGAMAWTAANAGTFTVLGQEPIKVGILHSLSGDLSMSGTLCKQAALLGINEINESGGVDGRQIETVEYDAASDTATYAEMARLMIQKDNVALIQGCTASSTRKAVKPVVEGLNHLLFYPTYFEGYEISDNIVYCGAGPNICITPGVGYLLQAGYQRFYLIGSDQVWSHLLAQMARYMIEEHPTAEVVKEEYVPFGFMDFDSVIGEMKSRNADVVISGVEGDSNVAMMKQMESAGLNAEKLPVMGLDTDEIYIRNTGPDIMKGHLVSSPYFMNLKNKENQEFVEKFKKAYGSNQVVGMFNESSYYTPFIWKEAIEKAGSLKPDQIRKASVGVSVRAPQGFVRMFDNFYVSGTPRAGRITGSSKGEEMIESLWSTQQPILPDPYLQGFPWGEKIATE